MDGDDLRDPVALAQALIRRPSVTPADAGAMDLVQGWLEALGFACRRMPFGGIENLYARRGTAAPNLCFAGHVDVVPPGDAAAWSADPFAGEVRPGAEGDVLLGRGAVDMKGGVAAWIAAVARVGEIASSLSLLITGDEEGEAVDGNPPRGRGADRRGRGDRRLRRGGTHQRRGARRHGEGRPPRQLPRVDHGGGRAGPRGLSPPRGQSRARAGGAAAPALPPSGWTRASPISSPPTWRSPRSRSATPSPT